MARQRWWIGILLAFLLKAIWLTCPGHGWGQSVDKDLLPKISLEEEEPMHIQADTITYDRKQDQYVAEGNVEITRGRMTLKADRVVLDNRTRVATAEGKVLIVQAQDRLEGDLVEMNLDDQTGRILKGTLFFERYNLIVQGEEIERLEQGRYRVVGATLSTCSGETPDWRFKAKEIDLTVDGLAKVHRSTFEVRNVPIIYIPYLSYPATTKRKTGFLMPDYRSDSRIGHAVSVPFFWAFHQSYDATFTQTYFTERGYQQGLEFRYAPGEWLDGLAYGEYIRDQRNPNPEVDSRGGSPDNEVDRWRFRMEQEADLPRDVVSRAQVDVVSDNYYLQDFAEDSDERFLRYLVSTLNTTKRWKAYLLAGEAEYYRNLDAPGDDNSHTPAKLPSILFRRTQVPIFGLPLSFGWDTTFNYFWREEGAEEEVIGLTPEASLPIHLGPFLTFTPFGRWREALFVIQDHSQGDETGRWALYEYGASLSTEAAKIYAFSGKGRILSMKHTLQPELRLDVTGHSTDGDWPEDLLDPLSHDRLMSFVRPEDLLDPLSHDRLVSFVLTQFLTEKVLGTKENVKFRELGRMRIVQSYSLREEWRDLQGPDDEREPFLPLEAELKFRLLGDTEGRSTRLVSQGPWAEPRLFLFADLRGLFDWYDQQWEELSLTMRGGDDRGDELALSYREVKRRVVEDDERRRKQIGGSLRFRVIPALDLMGQGRYDYEKDEWIRYGYGIELHPACWAIRFTHTIEPGFGDVETDHAFKLQVFLRGLGPVLSF